jgi:ABC-type oligopeptide transport system substrate-binding subunit
MFKMKNSNLKWTSMAMVAMMFAFITSCNNSQQEQDTAEEAENTEMGGEMSDMDGMDMTQQEKSTATVDTEGEPAFMQDYIDIRNSLVNDDSGQAKQAASDMQSSLENSELSQEQRNQLKESVSQLAEAQDIKAQRGAFAQLSQQLYQVVQNTDLNDKSLYWQNCAMAMGGQGANWLSYEEQVQNPYMGQRMPGCGSVEETIK